MAELTPVPFPKLVQRAFLECAREGKIFDLPKEKFFRGLPGLDLSVKVHGRRASTPLGPAAGPHGQLAQNIVLAWLGGSRVIELKTVQTLDHLKIPRPCIDSTNVAYNVEWSQELRLEDSLREYVAASMLIEMLKASRIIGPDKSLYDTVFDMSVGYNLEGLRSHRLSSWIQSMKHAAPIIEELREQLEGEWASYRDLPFPTCVSDTVSLSTFHGCPARELEGIAEYLFSEMDVHLCVKLNPTLLGYTEVEHLLHEVLGYTEIQLHRPAFADDLKMDEALDLIPRLESLARTYGKKLSVKFSNTLVVKNHRGVFHDDLMYMSGAPLHVLTMNLVRMFRARMGCAIPTSFSAGLDAHNAYNAVAMNLAPVTTCTDLLRPGGYARLSRYLDGLGEKMRDAGTTRIPDFIMRYGGQGSAAIDQVVRERALDKDTEIRLRAWLISREERLDDACRNAPDLEQALVDAAGLLNTPGLVEEATLNPRYRWARNKGVPRKIGSKLSFYDCLNCDKCIPACPNDANFVYETPAAEIAYDNFQLRSDGIRRIAGGVFHVHKARQFANFADVCNECGNCQILCPEDGGPFIEKPRFFGSVEAYRKDARDNGFHLLFQGSRRTIFGTIGGKAYLLILDLNGDRAWFENGSAEIELQLSSNQPVVWRAHDEGPAGCTVDMLPYYQLKLLAESVGNAKHVHFANIGGVN
jgi:putative selenate reductase